ncbi:unnamed protein product, partial [Protopolystoma xenopodis]
NLLPQLCRATTWLPINIQAKICRTWARVCKKPCLDSSSTAEFSTYSTKEILDRDNLIDPEKSSINLLALQKILAQQVTLRCLTMEQETPNEDKQIREAANVLRIVYFASLLAGQMDSSETLRLEAEVNASFENDMQAFYAAVCEISGLFIHYLIADVLSYMLI